MTSGWDANVVTAIATSVAAIAGLISLVFVWMTALAAWRQIWPVPEVEVDPLPEAVGQGRFFEIRIENHGRRRMRIFSVYARARPWAIVSPNGPWDAKGPDCPLDALLEPHSVLKFKLWIGAKEATLRGFALIVVWSRTGAVGRPKTRQIRGLINPTNEELGSSMPKTSSPVSLDRGELG